MSAPGAPVPALAPTILLPLLVVAGAILLFTFMDATVKGLPAGLTAMQIVALRFVFAVPPAALMAWRAGAVPSPAALRANGLRGVLVLGTTVLFFFALRHLPFAEALALSFLAPLFMVAMAALLLGERLSLGVLAALAVGLAGVAVVLSGRLTQSEAPGGGHGDPAGVAAAMGAALCYAASMILLRRQAQRDRAEVIVLIQQVVPALLAAPLAALDWHAPPPGAWPVLALLGLIGVVGHFMLTWAYARAPAGVLAIMEYTALPWAALIGYVVFAEVPPPATLIGGALILSACVAVTRLRR